MRVLRYSTENELSEVFRSSELGGRFGEEIVAGTRGWRIGWLENFPDDLQWHLIEAMCA